MAGGLAKVAPEAIAEGRLTAIADLFCHRQDRLTGGFQQLPGLLHPLFNQVLLGRQPELAAEQLGELAHAEVGHGGQLRQHQRLLEVIVEVGLRRRDAMVDRQHRLLSLLHQLQQQQQHLALTGSTAGSGADLVVQEGQVVTQRRVERKEQWQAIHRRRQRIGNVRHQKLVVVAGGKTMVMPGRNHRRLLPGHRAAGVGNGQRQLSRHRQHQLVVIVVMTGDFVAVAAELKSQGCGHGGSISRAHYCVQGHRYRDIMRQFLNTFFQAKEAVQQLARPSTSSAGQGAPRPLSEEFRQLLETRVVPLLAPLEDFRLHKLGQKSWRKTWFLRLGWLLYLPALALDIVMLEDGELTMYTLLVLLAAVIWVFYPEIQYVRHYKQKLMPVLVQAFGDYHYSEDGCVDLDALRPFEILPVYSSKSSEDYIRGSVEEVGFEFCELKLERRANRNRTNVHRGAILVMTMPFEFPAVTVVQPDFGRVGNLLAGSGGRERVTLAHPEFGQRYDVTADDPEYARHLLTPAMAERIIELDDLFRARAQGSGLSCEFRGNRAVFLLSYFGDLLDTIDIDVSAYDLEHMPLIEQELAMVTGMVRQLKLDWLASRHTGAWRAS